MNAEAADQALEIARKHYNNGNYVAARRFVNKSIALHPTDDASTLLSKIEKQQFGNGGTSASSSATSTGTDARSRPNAGSSSSTSSQSAQASSSTGASHKPKAREFTPAQAELVKRVKSCRVTEYYSILGLEKSCTDSDVKKAYRKLALGLHPDKCGAPGAEEAFKMVSKAFQILSDGNKRAIYDQTGSDPDSRSGAGGQSSGMHSFARGGGGGGGFGGEEMSPEDLFRFFFSGAGAGGNGPFGGGGGFQFYGPGGIRMQNGGARRGGGEGRRDEQTGSIWLQIAPLLLLFAFSLLTQLPSLFSSSVADPDFSFEPTARYHAPRLTSTMKVPFFVNPSQFAAHPIYEAYLRENPSLGFSSTHVPGSSGYKLDLTRFLAAEPPPTPETVASLRKVPRSLASFERNVEQTYVQVLQNTCRQELQNRNDRLDRARGFLGFGADWEKVRAITAEKLPRCEELSRLGYRVDYR